MEALIGTTKRDAIVAVKNVCANLRFYNTDAVCAEYLRSHEETRAAPNKSQKHPNLASKNTLYLQRISFTVVAMRFPIQKSVWIAIVSGTVFALFGTKSTAQVVWTGAGGNNEWATGANWLGGAAPPSRVRPHG